MRRAVARANWLEVIVVSAILGVLSTIAWPHFKACACKNVASEARSVIGALARAQLRFHSEHGQFATSIPELELEFEWEPNTSNHYEYILESSDQTSFTFATAKRDNLKSHVVGAFLIPETQSFTMIFCEAKQAGTEPIASPTDGQTCAPSSKVYGQPHTSKLQHLSHKQ